jgi:hypothetical protein
MPRGIKLAEYGKLPRPEQDKKLREMLAATKQPSNDVEALNEEISVFEQRYEVASDRMRSDLRRGKRQETWDVCQWLLTLNLRDRLARPATR